MESGKFIKTILCAQGTGVTFVELFHSPGNTHNVVLWVLFVVFFPFSSVLLLSMCVTYWVASFFICFSEVYCWHSSLEPAGSGATSVPFWNYLHKVFIVTEVPRRDGGEWQALPPGWRHCGGAPCKDLCPVMLLGRKNASLFAQRRSTVAHCTCQPRHEGEERHTRVL